MKPTIHIAAGLVSLAVSCGALATSLPPFIVKGSVDKAVYDGRTDDLLSAGLNADGLQSATPPVIADELNPTPTELRRLALWTNFRAISDMTTEGGYGVFWGPALAPRFRGASRGLIPGVEYKALIRGPGRAGNVNNVPVAVQIPRNFDPKNPCILLAPPSGSRGYYGGIAIAEWGLFEGCAVVMPGKGTGTGFHLLQSDEVYDRDGNLTSASSAGRKAQFAVRKSEHLRRFLKKNPNRVATKHAHSQTNSEHLWGDFALKGLRFGFWTLNRHFAPSRHGIKGNHRWGRTRFRPGNTLVIASGTSNAAGTSLRALEKDHHGLIDGLVVIEPNINPDSAGKFVIRYDGDDFDGHGTSLYEYNTLMGIYAPCAALSPSLANTPLNLDPNGAPPGARANRCEALQRAGLLTANTQDGQALEALKVLRDNGYYEAQDTLLASHEWLNLWRALNVTYANAHGRFAVSDSICDMGFAGTDALGAPAALPAKTAAILFATSGGVPATAGVELIDEFADNGPIKENLAFSPISGLQDLNLDGAACFRYLATGDESLLPHGAGPEKRRQLRRVQKGIAETLTTGDLHGTPSIILTGRSDALVFPNYHSRPYYGLNQLVEGKRSRLSYIEVVNAQHFEALISTFWVDPVSGDVQFVPLHYYLFQALDWMKGYLEGRHAKLPPSQVLRPVPRGSKAYKKSDAGRKLLPNIQRNPRAKDRITFGDGVLNIPN